MSKLLTTTAFLLLSLANVSYGQELTYLSCAVNAELSPNDVTTHQLMVLNLNEKVYGTVNLFKDEYLENRVDADDIEYAKRIINGTLEESISSVSSAEIRFASFYGKLDRISGEMNNSQDIERINGKKVAFYCSPINKSQAETLLKRQIERRSKIIKENEAERLF